MALSAAIAELIDGLIEVTPESVLAAELVPVKRFVGEILLLVGEISPVILLFDEDAVSLNAELLLDTLGLGSSVEPPAIIELFVDDEAVLRVKLLLAKMVLFDEGMTLIVLLCSIEVLADEEPVLDVLMLDMEFLLAGRDALVPLEVLLEVVPLPNTEPILLTDA
jgi:hypothetical protein